MTSLFPTGFQSRDVIVDERIELRLLGMFETRWVKNIGWGSS